MKPIIGLAVRRPISTLMCFLAVLIFGVIAASDLGVEFLPEIEVPKLVVTAAYPGLPPEQIKELLTIPLEDALSSVKGIRSVFSVSREGLCTVELDFHWGTDMMLAAVETREAIDLVYPSLPSDAKKPLVLPINPGEEPVVWVGLFPKAGDITLARRLGEREIRTRLQQAAGVGSIAVIGGEREEIQIDVDLAKCLGRGLTLEAIAQVISQSNYDFPAGSFTEGGTEFLVKTEGRLRNADAFGELVVGRTEQGTRVTLKEVAVITPGTHEKSSLFQLDGKEGVALLVRRKGGVSPLDMARAVRREVESLSVSYGRDLEFVIVKDASQVIATSVENLGLAALLGAVIAFGVLLLFLRRLRVSLILIVGIPVSVLISLLLLKLTGLSLNTMSLGGLAMGIGMLVDNSVVVLENLERRITGRPQAPDVIRHTAEMAGSTFGSTITSLVVFVPVIFLPGVIGALFRDLALAVCYSLFASFVVSITLVPVLYFLTGSMKKSVKKDQAAEKRPRRRPLAGIERTYRRGLRFALRRPLIVGLMVAGVSAGGVFCLLGLKTEFMPAVDSGEITVTALFPPGTSLEYTARAGRALSASAERLPGVKRTFIRAGGEGDDPYFLADPLESPEKLHMTVLLKDGAGVFRTLDRLTERLVLNGATVIVGLPDDIIAPLLGVQSGETVLLASGADQKDALDRAQGLRDRLAATGQFATINITPVKNKPGIVITPRREMLLRNGVNLMQAADTLRGYLDGLYPSRLQTEGREIDVRVRLREEDRANLEHIEKIQLLTGQNGRAQLSDLAVLSSEKDFSTLVRTEKKDAAYVELSPREGRRRPAGEAVNAAVAADPAVSSATQSAFAQNMPRIILTFALAILILYLVLGAQFESFTLPLFLLLSLPLAFSGITAALALFGKSINISSGLGALVLMGVVVNNSIILFENYKAKRSAGASVAGAIYRGSAERLKAVLITVMTTVTALLPIAFDPANKSSQSPMAAAIIGGLVVSTLLTLFVTPLVFFAWFRRKQ